MGNTPPPPCFCNAGCKKPAFLDVGEGAPTSSSSKVGSVSMIRFRDNYVLGQTLGEGAFGIVSECRRIYPNPAKEFKYAVKMVDKVEVPMEEIAHEVHIMNMLDHRSVVKCHAVFYEKFFVCIVMDKFAGGDLIGSVNQLWDTIGEISSQRIRHIGQQVVAAVAHLHGHNVIHRDIKGDNFVVDRQDILDESTRVALVDFGTAQVLKPGERCKSPAGTKIYWPPERHSGEYGFKADVFACGVILYGIVHREFPFRSHKDFARLKAAGGLKMAVEAASASFAALVRRMLVYEEDGRLSIQECEREPWILGDDTAPEPVQDLPKEDVTYPIPSPRSKRCSVYGRDSGPNAHQAGRRQNLLDRAFADIDPTLQRSSQRALATVTTMHALRDAAFQVGDANSSKGLTQLYEWWPQAKGEEKLRHFSDAAAPTGEATGAELAMVSKMLEEFGLNVCQFGQGGAKSVKELADEVHAGRCSLMLDAEQHKKLVRVVDVVELKLAFSADNGRRFVVQSQCADDNMTKRQNMLPCLEKKPHENTAQAVRRILKIVIGIPATAVRFDVTSTETCEERELADAYPGLETVYRKETVECMLLAEKVEPEVLKRLSIQKRVAHGRFESNASCGDGNVFHWLSDLECKHLHLWRTDDDCSHISAFVHPPVGFTKDELEQVLETAKLEVGAFEKDGARTLEDFSNELLTGEASLLIRPNDRVVRFVDVVLLHLVRYPGKEVLVQVGERQRNGREKPYERLPGAKRRPDENHFLAAKRILEKLSIDENAVVLQADGVKVLQEEETDSPSYPGVLTIYRKCILSATIEKVLMA
eukprot:TRINITY_DN26199_c0_g1_i2.p1 TRINITY_DN26199_c0_g1~~TRINITY_DN26199_c0_g1_i2.p1  ORF type:complete len:816 (+),score=177.41 TRINITY_DN26199_c0_g1_i2:196-2643(+)